MPIIKHGQISPVYQQNGLVCCMNYGTSYNMSM